MSSAQVNRVVRSNKVSAKHEIRLNVMLSEMAYKNKVHRAAIAGKFAGGNNNQDKVRALPKCRIGNYTPCHVTRDSAKHWAGSVAGAHPHRIAMNAAGGFRSHTVDNSEGAVLYIGINGNNSECGFVLAWQNTRFGNLVYVEAGPSNDYKCPAWDTIRTRLKVYGGTESYYKDNETGAEVSAKVGSDSDFIAAAVFDITIN